jgi:CheY-like chemotaxis protein
MMVTKALKQLEKDPYDLILMDCLMPILDGYETTRSIRQRDWKHQNTIIIALTANVLEGQREKCLDSGMNDYLSKPIELEKLATSLQHWSEILEAKNPIPRKLCRFAR